MESMKSVYVPSVRSPVSSISRLHSEFSGNVHDLEAPYSLKGLNLQKRSLINVHLPTTKQNTPSALTKIGNKTIGF